MLDFFPYPLLAGLGVLAVLLILMRRKRGRGYLFCAAVFGLYLLGVVSQIVFPIPLIETRSSALAILSRVNLIPFNFGGLFQLSPAVIATELGGNILLTVPFGFGLPFLVRVRPKHFPWLALGAGFATETLQLGACLLAGGGYRSVDINDVLLNTLGALLGFALFRAGGLGVWTHTIGDFYPGLRPN